MIPKSGSWRSITVLVAALALLGCGATRTGGGRQPLLHDAVPGVSPAPAAAHQLIVQRAVPQAALDFLSWLVPPAASTALQGEKGTSALLPYYMPADQPYTPGDAGYMAKSPDVLFPGLGDAQLSPFAAELPNNFSYIIYRYDDLTQVPQQLTVALGFNPPGAQVGFAAYNWAYGARGAWVPLYYGPASSGGSFTQLLSGGGRDFTNGSDDLAVVVFSVFPTGEVNISDLTLEPEPPVVYDELEPNETAGQANALPAFPFSGFTGNAGLGGVNDGLSTFDIFTFSAVPGDTVDLTVAYDAAADFTPPDSSGFVVFFFDQVYADTSDPTHLHGHTGSNGLIEASETLEPTWTAPFYLMVQDDNSFVSRPPTDYALAASK